VETWRVIIDPPSSAGYNMAVDEALADACRQGLGGPTLRLYAWDRPSISLGYFQRAEQIVDLDRCRTAGVPVVRRTTGGRAVIHHRELTYSFVAPVPHARFPPTIRGTYDVIARALVAGLADLGVGVESHAREPRRARLDAGSPLCFESISRYELTLRGRKVIGSAQRRWQRGFLQHGSLILAPAPEEWPTWFRPSVPAAAPVSGLSAMGRALALDEIQEAIRGGVERTLGVRLVPGGLTPDEASAAADTAGARDLTIHRYGAHAHADPGRGTGPRTRDR
jgi:lipoate-protein ligase A